jgi:hypothetical protein
MGNREVDGFHIWAEASQQGSEEAGAFVLTRAINGEALQSDHCAYPYVPGDRASSCIPGRTSDHISFRLRCA